MERRQIAGTEKTQEKTQTQTQNERLKEMGSGVENEHK